MKLRKRFSDVLTARMRDALPSALQTAWGEQSCVTIIENLTYGTLAGVHTGENNTPDFDFVGSFEGTLIVEISADTIDQMPLECLLTDLLQRPAILSFDPETASGQISEKCTTRLMSSRDSISDTRVVHQLRFAVNGEYGVRIDSVDRPGLWIGRAPAVGLTHENDYVPLDQVGALL